jgi:hypothetical protein
MNLDPIYHKKVFHLYNVPDSSQDYKKKLIKLILNINHCSIKTAKTEYKIYYIAIFSRSHTKFIINANIHES